MCVCVLCACMCVYVCVCVCVCVCGSSASMDGFEHFATIRACAYCRNIHIVGAEAPNPNVGRCCRQGYWYCGPCWTMWHQWFANMDQHVVANMARYYLRLGLCTTRYCAYCGGSVLLHRDQFQVEGWLPDPNGARHCHLGWWYCGPCWTMWEEWWSRWCQVLVSVLTNHERREEADERREEAERG